MTSPDPSPPPWREYALLGLLALLWGGSYPLISISLETITPVTLSALRVSIAAALLTMITLARQPAFPRTPGVWGALALQSVFNSIGAWTLLAWGQQSVPSSLAGVLNSTSPLFVVLITWLFLRGRGHTAAQVWGALLGLLGVILVLGAGALAGLGEQLLPQLATMAGALLYAMAAIYGQRFSGQSPLITAACTMLWACVVLIPAAWWLEAPLGLDVSARSALAAGALGVLCTGVAMLIYFRLLGTIGSLGVASQAYLRIVVAMVIGVTFLDEELSAAGVAGAVAVVAGLVLMGRRR